MRWSVELRGLVLASCVAAGLACASPLETAEPPDPDYETFTKEVYPILARDCAFPDCHGNPDRFFRIFSPGRTRLDPETPINAVPTEDELLAAYERSRSMLNTNRPEESRLVRKPLAESEGGGAHQGVDAFGRNVYRSKQDPAWITLLEWAGGEVETGTEMDAGVDAGTDAGVDAGTDAGVDAGTDAQTEME